MIDVRIMTSNGADTNRYRDVVNDVLVRMNHMLSNELTLDVTLTNWDYRQDVPRLVPAGELAARSLNMVDRAEALLAIFGRRLPSITCAEIRRAFERRQHGEQCEVWVFLNRDRVTGEHRRFFDELAVEFGEEIVYAHYSNTLDFQARLFTTLVSFVLRRLSVQWPTAGLIP